MTAASRPLGNLAISRVLTGLLATAVLTGGVLSWFASSSPDGLEWSMFKVSGHEELKAPANGFHRALAAIQEKTSLLPDYAFRQTGSGEGSEPPTATSSVADGGTTTSGLVGGTITLLVAAALGFLLRKRSPTA